MVPNSVRRVIDLSSLKLGKIACPGPRREDTAGKTISALASGRIML